MLYLYAFIILIILFLAYMRFEAGFIKVERVNFTKSRNCLKIIHLSDIHINLLKVPTGKVKGAIQRERPDLIILTGDYIERSGDVEKFLSFLENIKGGYRTYLCLGNHDYKVFSKDRRGLRNFIKEIKSIDVDVLHNRSVYFEKNSRKYNIIGLEDLREGAPDIDKALKDCCDGTFMSIAFSHNPDIVLQIPENKVDYLFCGHFHGGQIWAPFDIEFKLLRDDRLCKMGIKRGLHRLNGINLYISRGLGNVCFPLRFLSRPEITVYHLP